MSASPSPSAATPAGKSAMNDGARGRGLRWPALLLGLLLGLGLCAVTPWHNAYRQGPPLAGGHFPLAPFFVSFVLAVGAALLAKARRRGPILSGAEHLAIWAIMTVVSGFGWTGLARTFLVNVTAPVYFASAGNRWEEALQPLLPQGWFVGNATCVAELYNGIAGGRSMGWLEVLGHIHWEAWLPTLAVWGAFLMLALLAMFCLTSLIGTQWVVNERVNFPLMQTPQLLDEQLEAGTLLDFLSSKAVLAGLAVPVLAHLCNGLHTAYPSVPLLPLELFAGEFFPKHGTLSGFHKLKICIYPAFIGFAFLATRQISLSFWFFFLLGGLSAGVLASLGLQPPPAALGLTFGPSIAQPEEAQGMGAYLVFFLFLLWLGRRQARHVLRCSVGLGQSCGEEALAVENVAWLRPGLAFWGAAISLCLLLGWALYFGLPLLPTIMFLFLAFMVLVVASRVICQGGAPYFTLAAAPTDGMLAIFGSSFLGGAGLAGLAVMQKVLFLDLRESLMPSLFHASKAGEGLRGRGRFAAVLLVALPLGAAVAVLAMLALGHKYGMRDLSIDWAQRTTLSMYETVQQLAEAGQSPRPWVMTYAGVGAAVMLLLVLCYYRLPWWPIHPIGYLAAHGSGMTYLWFSFLAGWLCNHLTLHYGGAGLFKQVRNVFIGCILGDFLMGGAWALAGLFTDIRYSVFPV